MLLISFSSLREGEEVSLKKELNPNHFRHFNNSFIEFTMVSLSFTLGLAMLFLMSGEAQKTMKPLLKQQTSGAQKAGKSN